MDTYDQEEAEPLTVLLQAHIRGVIFNPARPEGLKFLEDGPDSFEIILRPAEPDNDKFGTWSGLSAQVQARYRVTSEARLFISSINNGYFRPYGPDAVSLPRIVGGIQKIEADGRLISGYFPPLEIYPAEIRTLSERVADDLYDKLSRFLGLIRWRQGIKAEHRLIEHAAIYWGIGRPLHIIPTPRQTVTLPATTGIEWNEDDKAELAEVWRQEGICEPLGHELLREAGSLASTSPRSSLLIAATALESGVKEHLGRISADTVWLLQNAPSPPIFKMLKDYIPLFHASRGNDTSWWQIGFLPVVKRVQKIVEARNQLTHTGHSPSIPQDIQSHIRDISDILYGLDVLQGHAWAMQRVSHSIRKDCGWSEPRRREMFVKILHPE